MNSFTVMLAGKRVIIIWAKHYKSMKSIIKAKNLKNDTDTF